MKQMSQREIHLLTEAVLRAEVIKRGGHFLFEQWANNFAARAAALSPAPAQLDLFGGAT